MANDRFHKEWATANERVREAEDRLGMAWAAYAAAKGPPPPKELLTEVSRLRRECDQRLAVLLAALGPGKKSGEEHPKS
jgi:hypothetical protein